MKKRTSKQEIELEVLSGSARERLSSHDNLQNADEERKSLEPENSNNVQIQMVSERSRPDYFDDIPLYRFDGWLFFTSLCVNLISITCPLIILLLKPKCSFLRNYGATPETLGCLFFGVLVDIYLISGWSNGLISSREFWAPAYLLGYYCIFVALNMGTYSVSISNRLRSGELPSQDLNLFNELIHESFSESDIMLTILRLEKNTSNRFLTFSTACPNWVILQNQNEQVQSNLKVVGLSTLSVKLAQRASHKTRDSWRNHILFWIFPFLLMFDFYRINLAFNFVAIFHGLLVFLGCFALSAFLILPSSIENMRYSAFSEISKLMRLKRRQGQEEDSQSHALDIFNEENLGVYSTLRKIMREAGNRQKQIFDPLFALIFILQCVLKPLIAYFTTPKVEVSITMVISLLIIKSGYILALVLLVCEFYRLNNQFSEDVKILQDSLTEAQDVHQSYLGHLNRKQIPEPTGFYEDVGFDVLRYRFQADKQSIRDALTNLQNAYQREIYSLESEEKRTPFKFLGVRIDSELVKPFVTLFRCCFSSP